MDRADFSDDCPGRLVPTIGDGWAFVPHPLPPAISWDQALVGAVSRAERELGRLDTAGALLPNPHLLISPYLYREAVLSSRIEGTQTLLPDLLMFDVQPEDVERRTPDVREVKNYVHALEHGFARLDELPLSLRLIRELHEKLMTGVHGRDRTPGEFRRVQNMIGSPECRSTQDARFMPPPPPEMLRALDDFEVYLHGRSELPPLVNLALIHYQFEAIHPFRDGNGRVGRLLISLWLGAQKLLSQPLLYLSAYFEHHRGEYYDRLLGVSLDNKWTEWIRFFLEGVSEQAADAVERSGKLLALRESFRKRLQVSGGSTRTLELADRLFKSPYMTASFAERLLGVSFPGAKGIIDKLVDAKILVEVTGQARNRVYAAEEVLRAIE